MLRKNYFKILMVAALFFIGGIAAYAQTAPVYGSIELKKGDGSTVPAANAVIDVYRTDAKGKAPSGKTDKKGNFSFAGLTLGQTYMFAVSAPGVQSQIFPNIKAGQSDLKFTVYEGDGKHPTEDEARAMLANMKNPSTATTTTAAATTAATAQDEAAAKKAKEDYEKQVAEVNAKNQKTDVTNKTVTTALKEGNDAFNTKNYDLALAKYDEGINAAPDFVGSAPVLLNNKAIVLKLRAVDEYNTGVKSADKAQKDEKLAAARKDFQNSLASFNKSYLLSKNAPATEITDQANYTKNKYEALAGLTEVYRLMAQTHMIDSSNSAEAKGIFQDYFTLETDAAKKQKAQFVLADMLREAGDVDNAVPEYRKALEGSPEDPDVLAGLGLSLFSVGVTKNDKTVMQEGLNFMEKFAQIAPANHPLKQSVSDAVTYLKTEQKLTPQKVGNTKKRN